LAFLVFFIMLFNGGIVVIRYTDEAGTEAEYVV
jgi:hypothetical protein